MNTVTIAVASLDKTRERLLVAFEGQAQGNFITFPPPKSYGKPSPLSVGT